MNDFPKFKTLKDQLAAEIAKVERQAEADPEHFRGFDWWQLNIEEEYVFDIDRDRFPCMVTVWACYDAFKLCADDPTWEEDLISAAREQYPQWCEPGISIGEFQAFAKEFAGLTFREAKAIYAKIDCWNVRVGLTTYADERTDEPADQSKPRNPAGPC